MIPAVDAPEKLALMRFAPDVGSPVRVFQAHLAPMTFLTLVKGPRRNVAGLGAFGSLLIDSALA